MKEKKKIFCPRCHRAVAIYDGKQTINLIAKCKKCKKLVVYHVDTEKTEIDFNALKKSSLSDLNKRP